MENGSYKLKDSHKSNSDVVVEISVKDDYLTCTRSESNMDWEEGEVCQVSVTDKKGWERIPNEETSLDESPEALTFKVGDKVKKKNGWPFIDNELIVTVDKIAPSVNHPDKVKVYFKETGTWEYSSKLDLFKPAHSLTPHIYADVIKAWADGHEVQSRTDREWHDNDSPVFNNINVEWRIKPQNPNQDRILEIENTITELQNELEELKNS